MLVPKESPATDAASAPSRVSYPSFIVITIIAVAILVRVIGLGHVPPPLFRDEAEKGYNAYCLLKTGCDYEGRRLPLFINVFGAHTSAIYQYATVPLVAMFGLKVWTIRLTAALAGIATVVFLYLLARALLDTPTALVATTILAFSPWHICFSRWAQQGIFMPLLFTIAAWGTVRFRQGWRAGLPIAAAAIALSAYAYDIGRVLAPLFLLLLAATVREELRARWRWTAASALVLAIVVAPTVWFVARQPDEALARFRRISIAQPGMAPAQVVGQFLVNYAKHFSPVYLAIRGDRELRHSTGLIGEIYPLELPFLVLGLYFLARRRNAAAAITIGWIAIGPVASSMTCVGIPHALRSLAAMPAFALATAVGVVEFIRWLSSRAKPSLLAILAVTELAWVAWFLVGYFAVYPHLSERAWQAGIGEALAYCRSQMVGGGEIWLTESVGGISVPPEMISPIEIFVAFHEQIPPGQFQQSRLTQTHFHVLPWGSNANDLLTGAKRPPKFVIAFVGEMPEQNRVAVFAEGFDYPGVAVYRF